MPPTLENRELLEKYSQISVDLGQGKISAQDPDSRGTADISYVASIVPAQLDGLGPHGTGTHSPEETLDIPSLTLQTKKAALLIYRLTHEG